LPISEKEDSVNTLSTKNNFFIFPLFMFITSL